MGVLPDLSAATSAFQSAAADPIRVPPICAHLFAATERVAAAFRDAVADRRMSRARCVVEDGGVSAALARYRREPTPDLVAIESAARGDELDAQLDALADVCGPDTRVILVGADNDVALYRELIARGVSDYLVAPLDPLTLIAAAARLFGASGTARRGRSVAFVGARGGAGSSTVAHSVAASFARACNAETILADLDMPFGSAGLGFNLDRTPGVAQALQDVERLDAGMLERLLTRCGDRLRVLAAPADLDVSSDLDEAGFARLLDLAQGEASLIALDLPHLWSPWMKKALREVDDVVITATPDLVSLRNARSLVDLLRQTRPNDAPPKLVLNQVGMPKRVEISAAKFAEALRLEPALRLPFEPAAFSAALNAGVPLSEAAPKSASARLLATFARSLDARDAPKQARKPRFDFRRLLRT